VGGSQLFQKRLGADGAEDINGFSPRGQHAVLPGKQEGGEVEVVINMEMAQHHVGDLLPR